MDKEFEYASIQTPAIFDDTLRCLTEMERKIEGIADDLSEINHRGNTEKVKGSSVSLVGCVIGLGSTLFPPATLGVSLGVSILTFAASWKGSRYSSNAESQMAIEMKKKHEESKDLLAQFEKKINVLTKYETTMTDIEREVTIVSEIFESRYADLPESFKRGNFKEIPDNIKRFLDTANKVRITLKVYKKIKEFSTDCSGATYGTQSGSNPTFCTLTDVTSSCTQAITSSANHSETTSKNLGKPVKRSYTAPKPQKRVTDYKKINAPKKAGDPSSGASSGISPLAVGLSVGFVALAGYAFFSALKDSSSICAAEKEMRSVVQNIRKKRDQINSLVAWYKEMINYKKKLEWLLQYARKLETLGITMPVKMIECCIEKINALEKNV